MTGTLADWLAHVEGLNPRHIDLGLERVRRVAAALDVLRPAPASVIVAGTNGKGSTSVCLEQILLACGYRVGCTLSPHLHSFNERIRLDGAEAEDGVLCRSFAAVEAARGDSPLTYFEFSCLAALHCFKAAAVDVAILEVGLGGRLDAFNIVDADVAVVTSIGLDHTDYLGVTREAVGREKAGVFRPGQRIVLGDALPPSVLSAARRCACAPLRLGREIRLSSEDGGRWRLEVAQRTFPELRQGALPLDNCALAAAAAVALDGVLGVSRTNAAAIRQGLAAAWLPGRLESISAKGRRWLVDVAHNPLGAQFLKRELARRWCLPGSAADERSALGAAAESSPLAHAPEGAAERVANAPNVGLIALFGNLADKDSQGIFRALDGSVRQWVLVGVEGPRGLSAKGLAGRGAPAGSRIAKNLRTGLRMAQSLAGDSDVILAFGSFAVAAGVRQELLNADA